MQSSLATIIGCSFALLFLLQPGAPPAIALATCSTSAQCSNDTVCQNSPLPGIKECKELRCNYDLDCPIARPKCSGGACRAPGGATGGGGGSTGMTQGGAGETCGPYKIGQVTKNRGCQQGLQCINGRCQPLAR